jgi:pimeloyl-ACP methyl ester carboxylesterase
VVFIHGSVWGADASWGEQRPLADRWTLVLADRPGYGGSPPLGRPDFAAEAPLAAELLDGGAHLVGHSYGGVIALLAAAERPDAVRSLTVIEPPAFALARGTPAVEALVSDLEALWRSSPRRPAPFLARFVELVGMEARLPEPLPPWLERGARLLMEERMPSEAAIPVAALAAAGISTMVVSGAHSPAFEAVCDILAADLGARRAEVPGAGHAVPRTGTPFNALLDAFLAAADSA